MESWGQDINLTDNDSAGLALTSALHTGVLRYPGGTGSNIWDPRTGHFLPIPQTPGRDAYHKYRGFVPFINDLPVGTMSAASFLTGLGGRARKVIWDLNVYTFSPTEACDQIRYISMLPGQQEPGVHLERGFDLSVLVTCVVFFYLC